MTSRRTTIRAAGGVVWRRREGALEFLLVHRSRYDDWSFPKGKAKRGEDEASTAVREVAEETGQRVRLGPRLGEQSYEAKGRPKRVVYFLMEAAGGSFVAGDEVDGIAWLGSDEARGRLSYEKDRALLDEAARRLGVART